MLKTIAALNWKRGSQVHPSNLQNVPVSELARVGKTRRFWRVLDGWMEGASCDA